MQCDEPCGMSESPLHVHHGIRDARDINWSNVEDFHTERSQNRCFGMMAPSDESLVVSTSQDPPGAELLFEANQAYRRGHLVHRLGIL